MHKYSHALLHSLLSTSAYCRVEQRIVYFPKQKLHLCPKLGFCMRCLFPGIVCLELLQRRGQLAAGGWRHWTCGGGHGGGLGTPLLLGGGPLPGGGPHESAGGYSACGAPRGVAGGPGGPRERGSHRCLYLPQFGGCWDRRLHSCGAAFGDRFGLCPHLQRTQNQ